MKRVNLVFLAVAIGSLVAVSFTSCKEKEGTYKTKDKLWKVYQETYTISDTGGKIYDVVQHHKTLCQVWKWDKNKLMQIESPDGWAINFVYKGKQVQSIECGSDVYTLTYDDKNSKLKKIEGEDANKRIFYVLTIADRNEDRITRFSEDETLYIDDANEKRVKKMRAAMSVLLGGNLGDIVSKNRESREKYRKASTVNKYRNDYELTYEGENVSQIIQTTTTTISDQQPLTVVRIFKYKYDSKVNPFHNIHHVVFNSGLFDSKSENNIAAIYEYASDDIKFEEGDTTNYLYQYNSNNVPTQRDEPEEKPGRVTHRIHYYEYVTK